MHITRIGLTPLKGARHADLDHLRLDPSGPRGDRLFCLLEADEDRVLRTVENPTMVLVSAARDGAVLTVTTPKGGTVAGEPVPTGHVVEADYWGRPARLEVMTSDHAELLGDHLDRPVRLAGIRSAGEVVYGGSVSIVTTGALRELGEHRLLCAHRDGPWGVAPWNDRVERWLAEASEHPGRQVVGRPLLVTTNDRGLGLYNGDTGVLALRADHRVVGVFGEPGLSLIHI